MAFDFEKWAAQRREAAEEERRQEREAETRRCALAMELEDKFPTYAQQRLSTTHMRSGTNGSHVIFSTSTSELRITVEDPDRFTVVQRKLRPHGDDDDEIGPYEVRGEEVLMEKLEARALEN